MVTETFTDLLLDPAHWEFELFLMLVFDGLIAGLFWPIIHKHWRHHLDRDRLDAIYVRSRPTQFKKKLKDSGWGWVGNHPTHVETPDAHDGCRYHSSPEEGANI
jgi:hypothetical protein